MPTCRLELLFDSIDLREYIRLASLLHIYIRKDKKGYHTINQMQAFYIANKFMRSYKQGYKFEITYRVYAYFRKQEMGVEDEIWEYE